MRKRLLIAGGTMTGLVCAVLLVLAMLPPRPEVSLTAAMQLTPGMSEADVAAVFGPPGDYPPPIRVPPPEAGGRLLVYSGRRGIVSVEFDAEGQFVRCYPAIHEISGMERVRLRLKRW